MATHEINTDSHFKTVVELLKYAEQGLFSEKYKYNESDLPINFIKKESFKYDSAYISKYGFQHYVSIDGNTGKSTLGIEFDKNNLSDMSKLDFRVNNKNKYDYLLSTRKPKISKIIDDIEFVEDNINAIQKLINFSKDKIELYKTAYHFKELKKLKPYTKWLDLDTAKPSDEARESMIQILTLYEEAMKQLSSRLKSEYQIVKIPTVSSGPFRISGYYGLIQLCLGSISLFVENTVGKFKFCDHPGLNVFTYVAEKSKKIDNLNILTSKRLIDVM